MAAKTQPILTAAMLRMYGPCFNDFRDFCEAFPNGAPVTVASLRKARKLGLDVDFIIGSVIPERYRKGHTPAAVAYRKADKAMDKELERADKAAWKKYPADAPGDAYVKRWALADRALEKAERDMDAPTVALLAEYLTNAKWHAENPPARKWDDPNTFSPLIGVEE